MIEVMVGAPTNIETVTVAETPQSVEFSPTGVSDTVCVPMKWEDEAIGAAVGLRSRVICEQISTGAEPYALP